MYVHISISIKKRLQNPIYSQRFQVLKRQKHLYTKNIRNIDSLKRLRNIYDMPDITVFVTNRKRIVSSILCQSSQCNTFCDSKIPLDLLRCSGPLWAICYTLYNNSRYFCCIVYTAKTAKEGLLLPLLYLCSL
jgi:hypothetical protein